MVDLAGLVVDPSGHSFDLAALGVEDATQEAFDGYYVVGGDAGFGGASFEAEDAPPAAR